jgi:dephospho-CoA kinase
LFAEFGVTVIDSDEISHQLTQSGGGAIDAIRSEFGASYISVSGALDRALMRQRVFSDTGAKQQLEAILHPLIYSRMLAQAEVCSSASPYVLMVIPLLFEKEDYLKLVQRSLTVNCAEATQIERAMRRSGLTEQEVRAIMARQISSQERLLKADDVIENDAGMDTLKQQVLLLHHRYTALFSGSD